MHKIFLFQELAVCSRILMAFGVSEHVEGPVLQSFLCLLSFIVSCVRRMVRESWACCPLCGEAGSDLRGA